MFIKLESFLFQFYVYQEVFFYTFESNTEPLLQALSRSIADVYVPFLQVSETSWGKLTGSDNNQMIKVDFISRLNNFVTTLNSAQESINERILLKPCDKIDLTNIQNTADYISIASNSESLASIEETMKTWIKQMEQVKNKIQSYTMYFFFISKIGFSRK